VPVWSWQRNTSIFHQLFRFAVQTDYMHSVFSVVSMFMFEFSAVNILLTLLPERSFHLVIGKSKEWLHMPLREENLRAGRNVFPRVGRKFERCEQKMQSRWITLSGESCPLQEGV